jgi:hypothetical protein
MALDFFAMAKQVTAECAYCNRHTMDLCQCPCRRAYYCDAHCQSDHWAVHRTICGKGRKGKVAQASCSFCGAVSASLKTCRCETVLYCSTVCQAKHHGLHRRTCSAAVTTFRSREPLPSGAFRGNANGAAGDDPAAKGGDGASEKGDGGDDDDDDDDDGRPKFANAEAQTDESCETLLTKASEERRLLMQQRQQNLNGSQAWGQAAKERRQSRSTSIASGSGLGRFDSMRVSTVPAVNDNNALSFSQSQNAASGSMSPNSGRKRAVSFGDGLAGSHEDDEAADGAPGGGGGGGGGGDDDDDDESPGRPATQLVVVRSSEGEDPLVPVGPRYNPDSASDLDVASGSTSRHQSTEASPALVSPSKGADSATAAPAE